MRPVEFDSASDSGSIANLETSERFTQPLERQSGSDGYRSGDGGFMPGASTPRELPPLLIAMNDSPAEAPPRRQEKAESNSGQYAFNEKQYGQALTKAAEEGKPVVIKVGTEWCGPCQAMKRNTLENAAVKQNLKDNAVFLDVDADRAEALARSLGVDSYPTTIVAAIKKNAQGQLELQPLKAKSGYMDANGFNKFLNENLPAADKVMDANGFTGKPAADRPAERKPGPAEKENRPEERRPDGGDARTARGDVRTDRAADGSEVETRKFADGSERVSRVKFPDGKEIRYGFDRQGRVCETRDFDSQGREILNYRTADGTTWVEQQGRGPQLNGRLEVRADGTHVFSDAATGCQSERKADGSLKVVDASGRVIYSSPAARRSGR